MKREKFGSRLGFILISAGCAIGLGNVWRFPYITGKYGGAAFVLIYLLFLVLLGLPIMVMEFAVGRGSQASIALSFDRLEPLGTKWHWYKWFGIGGNYLLMMFYTTIGGWLLLYTGKMAIGEFKGLDADGVTGVFTSLLGQPVTMTICMILVVVLCFGIVCMGLQKGVEQITKKMMILLFVLMIILAVRSVTLPGAEKGLEFYLLPDFKKAAEAGLKEVIFAAMGQAFMGLEETGHRVSYFSLTNLSGALISIGIGTAVYLLVIRTALMDQAGRYINVWPVWLDLENLIYRPVLRLLILLAAICCRVLDCLVDFLVVLLRRSIYRDSPLPHELPEGNVLTVAAGKTANVFGWLGNHTWRRKHPVERDYVHVLAVRYEELKENNMVIGRSLSFALLLLCIGFLLTLFYLIWW